MFPRARKNSSTSVRPFVARITDDELRAQADAFLSEEMNWKNADETFAALWRWHAVEELEHKAVAFDVYERTVGAYAHRVLVMALVTLVFGYDIGAYGSAILFLRNAAGLAHSQELRQVLQARFSPLGPRQPRISAPLERRIRRRRVGRPPATFSARDALLFGAAGAFGTLGFDARLELRSLVTKSAAPSASSGLCLRSNARVDDGLPLMPLPQAVMKRAAGRISPRRAARSSSGMLTAPSMWPAPYSSALRTSMTTTSACDCRNAASSSGATHVGEGAAAPRFKVSRMRERRAPSRRR